ncbi:GPO family capsid scaffolding protein [Providencia hangzhouensis]|uniref:GPO family capsid scaffolding protein n=1 Tax=Providencia TaxID=586 RepID=UPI000D87F11E|nr:MULTISPECIES: GPO family capsid scaffolding protein [Providencia]EHZ7762731.1 GPO family capsid scaffolding protein [Providencia rettgeri]EIJ7165873.1 GPO family capsid scaffolding protein [Providencia rettgeri]ELR5089277.1 GPO family capsid scaffolding protein [Providencia rettgeri]ELR5205460.1 GPO family capsid scaffolding protein [Providencia rettgeri]EMD0752850.1 GPO family capsid scaffolding protein [Providencia rettgeri]
MTKKSKPVRLCVEGATTDGRKVQRQWLTDIAKNYDPSVYGARINMEHLNYEWMPRFGDVESVYTEEISEGALKGKLALYGILSPTDSLIEMNRKRQKVYTSVEINPNFSDMNSAYLVGLAVTDNPASLGTSMLEFSAGADKTATFSERKQDKDNVFTAAEETVIEFTEEENKPEKPSLKDRIMAKFSRERQRNDVELNDIHQAVELCAEEQTETAQKLTRLETQVKALSGIKEENETLRSELDQLKKDLSQQDNQQHRPTSFGGNTTNTENLTDC